MRFRPVLDLDESDRRRLYTTKNVSQWLYEADGRSRLDFKADLRAFLKRFVVGAPMENGADFKKANPKGKAIWAMRIRFRPQVRMFGGFADMDIFVCLLWRMRDKLEKGKGPKWDAAVAKTAKRWDEMFPGLTRRDCVKLSHCLSESVYD